MRYQAVLFDLDGLLIDSERLSYNVLSDFLIRRNLTLPEGVFQRMLSVSNDACDAILRETFGDEAPLFSQTGAEYRRRIAAGALHLMPGAPELLDRLDALGVKRAIASSNSGENVGLSLQSTGLRTRFETIVHGDMVAHVKPAPDLFLEAARRLDVEPVHCLVLEDAFGGVQAANAAGMDVALVPDFLAPNDEIRAACTAICKDLHEVAARFFPLDK